MKKNLFYIIIISVVLGLFGGIASQIITRTYFADWLYEMPFWGDVTLPEAKNPNQLIISGAKKVVVEQDTKIVETINSVNESIVGIYSKKKEATDQKFNPENFYQINGNIGQGLVITSDGWVVAMPFSADKNPDNYVIIAEDKKIYNIDKIIEDPLTKFYFIHAQDARDLSISKFVDKNENNIGQIALAVGWGNNSMATSVVGREDSDLIKSSDYFVEKIILADSLEKFFYGSPIFNLSGNLIGLINKNGEIIATESFRAAINSLLKYKEIRRASLGINYIELTDLVTANKNYEKGILIYKNSSGASVVKNSSADKAGLKEGDIIISFDNVEMNKDVRLFDLMQNYLAGDKINLIFSREGKSQEAAIELGKISN
ncbi:MAG: S1C family serine protease [Patescibacteria group bacterium]|nr:S1C family serine protease [Patescibacteria group bacterium]MDD4611024.1 S1C family serine protease [Patescibacteria group bacterium]